MATDEAEGQVDHCVRLPSLTVGLLTRKLTLPAAKIKAASLPPHSKMTETLRSLITIAGVLVVVLTIAAGLIWLERRLLALWQDRYGPNRVGPAGLLQVLADTIKLLWKEDWIPPFADKPVFVIAPAIVFVTVLLSFAVLPIVPGVQVVRLNVALLFFLGMSSLGVYSVVLAG